MIAQGSVAHTEDWVLLRRIAGGDEVAAREFYDSHCDALFRFIRRRFSVSIEDAEEITDDTFLSALEMAATYEGKCSLSTWLFSLARNRVIDHKRHAHAAKRIPEEQLVRIDDESRRKLRSVHDASVCIDDLVEQIDRVRIVQALLNSLTPDQREVVAMRYIEGLSVPEIARICNRSTGSVERLLERAKAGPRRQMLNWLGEESFRMLCFNLLSL